MADAQEVFDQASQQQGYSTPRPDPTERTTSELMREIARLDKAIAISIAAVDARLSSEMDGRVLAVGERLTAEIKLTNARFDATDAVMEATRDIIEEKVDFAKQDRASIRAEIKGRFTDAAKEHQAIRDLTQQKFMGVAEEHTALRILLDERYATQVKALDAAFVAQQTAVRTSFEASEKQIAASLLATKEAGAKQDVATEKRFDGVNELLAQINATVSVLLPRAEAESRMSDLDRRVGEIKSTIDKGFTNTDTRTEIAKDNWGYLIGALGLVAVAVTIVLEVVNR